MLCGVVAHIKGSVIRGKFDDLLNDKVFDAYVRERERESVCVCVCE